MIAKTMAATTFGPIFSAETCLAGRSRVTSVRALDAYVDRGRFARSTPQMFIRPWVRPIARRVEEIIGAWLAARRSAIAVIIVNKGRQVAAQRGLVAKNSTPRLPARWAD